VTDKRAAVFLDRDGVLNEAVVIDGRPHPPGSVSDLVVRAETIRACRQLHDAGLFLLVVTNQPDIARGIETWSNVQALNDELRRQLPLDDVRVCPHDDADACECRKPRPGMLLDGARIWNLDLARSVMVGDRWRDVEAGNRAGCWKVLLERGYSEQDARDIADLIVRRLDEAVPWIISITSREKSA
jgi:D-glycero-D-manno-heptose 1,7-bisphosphate phosphatase